MPLYLGPSEEWEDQVILSFDVPAYKDGKRRGQLEIFNDVIARIKRELSYLRDRDGVEWREKLLSKKLIKKGTKEAYWLFRYILRKPRNCLLYTSPSPRDLSTSRMPSSA